jgi:hypothetical protein
LQRGPPDYLIPLTVSPGALTVDVETPRGARQGLYALTSSAARSGKAVVRPPWCLGGDRSGLIDDRAGHIETRGLVPVKAALGRRPSAG